MATVVKRTKKNEDEPGSDAPFSDGGDRQEVVRGDGRYQGATEQQAPAGHQPPAAPGSNKDPVAVDDESTVSVAANNVKSETSAALKRTSETLKKVGDAFKADDAGKGTVGAQRQAGNDHGGIENTGKQAADGGGGTTSKELDQQGLTKQDEGANKAHGKINESGDRVKEAGDALKKAGDALNLSSKQAGDGAAQNDAPGSWILRRPFTP